ncbi:uncharacterized protein LOC142173523 [Nicotiana tabacum]|uniref:Uncharacterized protein LOC142173523 n=1 Tax=Nicotiana tabacum TaxID=4097 RepID=A0AC58TDC7_TOBAC
MVISWLTNSLTPDIAGSVQYSDTAQSIWTQLNKRYGIVNGTRVFEIKQELAFTSQGSLDIASYFNKLKKLWDELGFMCASRGSSCTCTAKSEIKERMMKTSCISFLWGLMKLMLELGVICS